MKIVSTPLVLTYSPIQLRTAPAFGRCCSGATPDLSHYLISYEIKKLNMKGENNHERIR